MTERIDEGQQERVALSLSKEHTNPFTVPVYTNLQSGAGGHLANSIMGDRGSQKVTCVCE